jgi:hypothetical protein
VRIDDEILGLALDPAPRPFIQLGERQVPVFEEQSGNHIGFEMVQFNEHGWVLPGYPALADATRAELGALFRFL